MLKPTKLFSWPKAKWKWFKMKSPKPKCDRSKTGILALNEDNTDEFIFHGSGVSSERSSAGINGGHSLMSPEVPNDVAMQRERNPEGNSVRDRPSQNDDIDRRASYSYPAASHIKNGILRNSRVSQSRNSSGNSVSFLATAVIITNMWSGEEIATFEDETNPDNEPDSTAEDGTNGIGQESGVNSVTPQDKQSTMNNDPSNADSDPGFVDGSLDALLASLQKPEQEKSIDPSQFEVSDSTMITDSESYDDSSDEIVKRITARRRSRK